MLSDLFGEPIDGDGYKVSGEWIFESEEGDIVTLYDWKQTNLYDPSYPTVEEFRNEAVTEFSIGGHNKEAAKAFKRWLMEQLFEIN